MKNINKLNKKRFQFIKRLYELSGGDIHKVIDREEIAKELFLSQDELKNIIQYLSGEQLLKCLIGSGITITHDGILKIEKTLSESNKKTQGQKSTKVEKYFRRRKNHPIASIIIIAAVIVIGIGTFTDSVDKIITFAKKYILKMENQLDSTSLNKTLQFKNAKININRLLEDYEIELNKIKKDFYEECRKIEAVLIAKNIGRSTIALKSFERNEENFRPVQLKNRTHVFSKGSL